MTAEIEHGGALDRAVTRFGGHFRDWLDLSTGINPEHFPLPQFDAAIWNRLPDEGLYQRVLDKARQYYRVADGASLVAAPGTQALIQLIPRLTEPATVAILGPTYQEHAHSFASAGWKTVPCMNLADIPADAKAVVVVNPNNPDGRVIARDALLTLAQSLGVKGGFLVVDEAFADPHPDASVADDAAHAPLIVLKSFGKFFGLAGVRLGFMFANEAVIESVNRRLGPWAVSGPALAIAEHAFGNPVTVAAFASRIRQRRAQLTSILQGANLEEVGRTALFSLVKHPDAPALYQALCEQHILVRKFDYAPQWLRIGLALDDAEFKRLKAALAHVLAV